MTSLSQLISIGGAPLGGEEFCDDVAEIEAYGKLGEELLGLLQSRNGFYAFESALHVFPAGPSGDAISLNRWNSSDLWRYEYGNMTDGMSFFAEDAFGLQFCLFDGWIRHFNSELGSVERISPTLDGWAKRILSERDTLVGYHWIQQWQEINGACPQE